ncbi:hypothetical protein DXG01_015759, partial [Tephrocybe rancida]
MTLFSTSHASTQPTTVMKTSTDPALVTLTATTTITLPSPLPSTTPSTASTQHTGTGLNNGPLHAEHPVEPLQAIQNAVAETLPAPKRAKTVPLAVPGTGLTEKNFAMRKWLKSNAGGLKVDFETYFKGISPAEKKDFEAEVKKA